MSGCASRMPNTVSTFMPGDSEKSCETITLEMNNIESEMNRKWAEKNQQNGINVALGVAGAFLIFPWFFMDMSGAEKTEWESYKKRFDHLGLLLADKKCSPFVSKIKTTDINTSGIAKN